MRKFFGYTLAEVLITLGVIGVVAAMTLPTVINKYQKSVVETRLKNFYSTINQALQRYVAENGDLEPLELKNYTYNENKIWLEQHILPYIKYKNVKACNHSGNVACVYLNNGDSFNFSVDTNGGGLSFCIKCDAGAGIINSRKKFAFEIYRISTGNIIGSKNFIEPYTFIWDGTINHLKNHKRYGCRKDSQTFNFCTKYIQLNNWKIPDDYPW